MEEVARIPTRADYNINHNDLYIAIEDTQKRIRAEEEKEEE